MAEIFCEPLQPIKSSAQTAVDDNLSKPVEPFRTFAITGKTGDVVVPANVHVRFYNCNFDKFTAIEGNNIFYFEQCVFTRQAEMTNVTFIAAGSTFVRGAILTTCKGELVEHTAPSAIPSTTIPPPTPTPTVDEGGVVVTPCRVNDTLYMREYCQVSSKGTIFEWLDVTADFFDMLADFVGDITDTIKSMLALLDFSRFESMLDQFLNIPFCIFNMVNGCIAKFNRMVIGKIDALLAPAFRVLNSAKELIAQINRLITTIRSVPQRVAQLYKRCYAKIVNTATLISQQAVFTINQLSKVDVMLTQRIISLKGSIASVKDSSKFLAKNVKQLVSPEPGTYEAMFKLDGASFVELARIGDITTAGARLCSVKNKSLYRLFAARKVESTSQNADAIVEADDGDVDISRLEACKTEVAAVVSASKDSNVRLNDVGSIESISNTTALFSATTGAIVSLNSKPPTSKFEVSLLQSVGA